MSKRPVTLVASEPEKPAVLTMLVNRLLELTSSEAKLISGADRPAYLHEVGPLRLIVIPPAGDALLRVDAFFVEDDDAEENGEVEERFGTSDRLFALSALPTGTTKVDTFKPVADWYNDVTLCLMARIEAADKSAQKLSPN